jgi:predicted N-formylglutamate amidohydrolase
MGVAEPSRLAPSDMVRVRNPGGSSPWVIVCDHASNFVPRQYGTLGLDAAALTRHIAWDPGALPVAERMAQKLDATLVQSCVSRLVIDCNRAFDAPDLIATLSETTEIPGNRNLSSDELARRIALAHRPFHDAIDEVVRARLSDDRPTWLASVHSFTPVYRGVPRPWQIGIIHDDDIRLSAPLIAALSAAGDIAVGDNQPYSPADRVYYTLERHARSRGLPCVMIEIRNDEIGEERSQLLWGDRLGGIFAGLAGSEEFNAEEVGATKADALEIRQKTHRGR